jgi:hypothetical protein
MRLEGEHGERGVRPCRMGGTQNGGMAEVHAVEIA